MAVLTLTKANAHRRRCNRKLSVQAKPPPFLPLRCPARGLLTPLKGRHAGPPPTATRSGRLPHACLCRSAAGMSLNACCVEFRTPRWSLSAATNYVGGRPELPRRVALIGGRGERGMGSEGAARPCPRAAALANDGRRPALWNARLRIVRQGGRVTGVQLTRRDTALSGLRLRGDRRPDADS